MVFTAVWFGEMETKAAEINEQFYGSGPIRSMTVLDDGTIVGGRRKYFVHFENITKKNIIPSEYAGVKTAELAGG